MAHYLITGHTGFKGSWMALLLKSRGHTVSGLALDPLPRGLFERAGIAQDLEQDLRVDIRDREAVFRSFESVSPDFVVHMAAQALVRQGYRDPVGTYETNVDGTLNVLLASARTGSIQSQLVVTTDKVYRDDGRNRPYVESDSLGGKDPYSMSKAMADLLAQEFFRNERTKPGAIVRGGNVIGAGDASPDRLLPDIVRAKKTGLDLEIRYPQAVRPWQHVYDCLGGYLEVLGSVASGDGVGEWNIGPASSDNWTVANVVDFANSLHADLTSKLVNPVENESEAHFLQLDCSKALGALDWRPKMSAERALREALAEISAPAESDLRELIERQIIQFEAL